jgi:hypothetical protein
MTTRNPTPDGTEQGADEGKESSELRLVAVIVMLIAAQILAVALGGFLGYAAARISAPADASPPPAAPVVVVRD